MSRINDDLDAPFPEPPPPLPSRSELERLLPLRDKGLVQNWGSISACQLVSASSRTFGGEAWAGL
jgi:hypothetical protein